MKELRLTVVYITASGSMAFSCSLTIAVLPVPALQHLLAYCDRKYSCQPKSLLQLLGPRSCDVGSLHNLHSI